MERKTYLNRYRLYVDRIGIPFVIRRSTDEATLKADDIQTGDHVAVQVEPAAAFGPEEREQLEAEARAAQQIDHINIPRLRDFGFDSDQLVYVTDYLEGTTAEDWIKAKGPMPVSAVLRIASQAVSALVAASLHGIIHYAVHPGNIILAPGETKEGEWPLIKLLNLLGVAPTLFPSNGQGSVAFNPADFASPEQLTDGPVTFRSEIYSLGCTLWFLLKGLPLSGGAAAVQDSIGLSAPVRQLLAGMVAENPADRPADPLTLQQQIQNCLAHIDRRDVEASKFGLATAVTPMAPFSIEPSRRRHSMRKSLALAAILLAIATLAAVILAQRTHQPPTIEAAATGPEAPAAPFVPESRPAQNAATEKETDSTILASNVVASENKNDEAPTDNVAVGELNSSPQIASKDFRISTPSADITSIAPPVQESIERPAPAIASSSSSPDPRIAAMEAASEQLPLMIEELPPAEGPIEREKPIAEISPDRSAPAAEEDVRKDLPIASPKVAPEKISKPEHSGKATKKNKVAATSRATRPGVRNLSPRQYPAPSVGHIFPPVWPGSLVPSELR